MLRSIGSRPAPPASEDAAGEWAALRTSQSGDDQLLGAAAQAWLEHLPQHAQPRRLASRHPRIVNRLAEVWADSRTAANAIDMLMIDERGGRTGFSPAIRAELMRLQYLQRELASDAARPRTPATAPSPQPAATQPQADHHHSDA
ncbi:MAG: hypothetical protein ABIO45_00305 [Burkholderiaceae bacterium]